MQIDEDGEKNGYTSSKVVMELWDFDNSSQHQHQLWTVTHLGDGYYKIISVISGKALSVKYGEQNTENTALIQEDYKGLYRQQWMFVHLENGNFKIKPKSSLNSADDFCAVAGSGEGDNDNGRRVEQGKYVADSLYTDEWSVMFYDIYNASRVVKVDVLYDFGFAQRYGGRTYQVIGTQLTELNRTADPNYQFDDNCIYGFKHAELDVVENVSICAGCRKAIWDSIGKYNHK